MNALVENWTLRYIICLIFSCLFINITTNSLAQKNPNQNDIKSYIKDAQSTEAFPYANILLKGINRGTTANIDGYFVLVNVPVDIYTLHVQYIGHERKNIEGKNIPGELSMLTIKIKQIVIKLGKVIVTAKAEILDASSKQVIQITFSQRQLSSLPSISETAIFWTMQLLPGISGASEGESGLYISG